MNLQILYQDNHLLAVYKPGGLPVQADDSGDLDLLNLAKMHIKQQFNKPGAVYLGLVHRLDRPARGVVVLARTSKAAARLSQQFREHTVRKIYLAAVHGKPKERHGELTNWLESDERGSRIVAEDCGKFSRLCYELLQTDGERSLLQVELETGRKHQIRAQLAAIGCPLLGDLKYGAPYALLDGNIALLAAKLEVEHPVSKRRIEFEAQLPLGWPWQPKG